MARGKNMVLTETGGNRGLEDTLKRPECCELGIVFRKTDRNHHAAPADHVSAQSFSHVQPLKKPCRREFGAKVEDIEERGEHGILIANEAGVFSHSIKSLSADRGLVLFTCKTGLLSLRRHVLIT